MGEQGNFQEIKPEEKKKRLEEYLRELGSVAVSFSGGVDSTFLLKVAHDVLGDKAVAVTACSCSFPERELKEAQEFCRREGIRHIIIESDELGVEGFRENPRDRCYLCKRELFQNMWKVVKEENIDNIAEGSNLDDNGDYRPGLRAVAELGIKSPLRQAGMTKQDIRRLSKEAGLPTWKKPSFACLASRFVYGETITEEKLSMVDRAEQLLLDMGLHQVRVRMHGSMARIEVMPEELSVLVREENRSRIVSEFEKFGFSYVTLDLKGYRTGSMNETL